MPSFEIDSVQCLSPAGLHRMAYKQWGDRNNPDVVVCVHGVTRVADDFDRLAAELSRDFRVICPYVVGRGSSDWLRDSSHYVMPQYVADMVTLIARLNVQSVSWVGTSMGGLIGILLSSLPATPVHKLVINDVGPTLDGAALARIGEYLGQVVRFDGLEEAITYVKSLSATFGSHTDAEWNKMARDVLRQNEDGSWTRNYDPGIAVPVKNLKPETAAQFEAALWAGWDRIVCPTLLLRGAESDLLTSSTAEAMMLRNKNASLIEFAEVGHAPTLLHDDQISAVTSFLRRAWSQPNEERMKPN